MNQFISRISSLDVVRTIASVLVVLFHTHSVFIQTFNEMPFGGLFGEASSGVDIFFVLSGFLITHVHVKDFNHPSRWPAYIYKRFIRILPLLWIVTVLATVIYLFGFGGSDKISKINPVNFISTVMLLPQNAVPIVNVSWTLKYEALFYLVIGVMVLNRRLGTVVFCLWQSATVVLIVRNVDFQSSIALYYFRPRVLEFGFGSIVAFGILYLHRSGRRPGTVFSSAVFVAGTAAFVLAYIFARYSLNAETYDTFAFGLSSACALFGVICLENRWKLSTPSFFKQCGEATFSVYLVHFSVISALATMIKHIGISHANDLTAAITSLSALGIGYLFYRKVDAPLGAFFRRRGGLGKSA